MTENHTLARQNGGKHTSIARIARRTIADHETGLLTATAAASDTTPIGRVSYAGGAGDISYGSANGQAWVRLTQALPPGEYIVLTRFKDARTSVSSERGWVADLPEGNSLTYNGGSRYIQMSTACSGCSGTGTDTRHLTATPVQHTFARAVVVPEGPEQTLTITARLLVSALISGEGHIDIEASAIVDRISIVRGEEEIL